MDSPLSALVRVCTFTGTSVALTATVTSKLDAATVAGWLTAVGIGGGIAFAGFYERYTKARIEAQKAWDNANRDSLSVQLIAAKAERQALADRLEKIEHERESDRAFIDKLTEGLIKLSVMVGQERGAVETVASGEVKAVKADGV